MLYCHVHRITICTISLPASSSCEKSLRENICDSQYIHNLNKNKLENLFQIFLLLELTFAFPNHHRFSPQKIPPQLLLSVCQVTIYPAFKMYLISTITLIRGQLTTFSTTKLTFSWCIGPIGEGIMYTVSGPKIRQLKTKK